MHVWKGPAAPTEVHPWCPSRGYPTRPDCELNTLPAELHSLIGLIRSCSWTLFQLSHATLICSYLSMDSSQSYALTPASKQEVPPCFHAPSSHRLHFHRALEEPASFLVPFSSQRISRLTSHTPSNQPASSLTSHPPPNPPPPFLLHPYSLYPFNPSTSLPPSQK